MGQVYEEFEIGQEVALKSSYRSFKDVTLIAHTENDVDIEPTLQCLCIATDGSVTTVKIHKNLLEVKEKPSNYTMPIV